MCDIIDVHRYMSYQCLEVDKVLKPKERQTWDTSFCQERKKVLLTSEHLLDTYMLIQKLTEEREREIITLYLSLLKSQQPKNTSGIELLHSATVA